MVRLVISDMDGTLLNGKGEIDPEFWEIEKQLKKNNIIFCVASGRQYYTLLEQFKDIKDNTIFIAENGTYVMFQGKEIFSDPIPLSQAHYILEETQKIPNTQIVLCGKRSAYVRSDNKKFSNEVAKYYLKLEEKDDLLTVKDDIFKIAFCNQNGTEKYVYPFLKDLKDKFSVVVSGNIWLDIAKKNSNKGNAVKIIQQKLNIPYEETMVFGDYLNDLEMMSYGKYSFAMENAHPLLKKVSNYRAKSNLDNGVLEAIKEYILLGRK